MPDQALQQYAMMNKEDPYIMALALSESRRRKQMRTAAAPQQQAQPKVADQALMEMSPAGGVDALPTEEMNFAGGGIVAFADGGDVERYQAGGLPYETPYDRMNRLNREAAAAAPRGGDSMGGFMPDFAQSELMSSAGALQAKDAERAQRAKTLAELEQKVAFLTSTGAPQAAAARAQLEAFKASGQATLPPAAPAAVAATDSGMDRRLATGSQPKIDSVTAAAAPKENRGLGGTPEAKAMRQPAPATAKGPSVQGAKDLAGQFYDTEAQKAEIDKYMAEQRADVAAARERRNEGKPTGKAYSKYEEMLQGEEGRAGKERDEATGVAIFRAGLAMMGGTSPRAFENISKGALAGLDDYTAAMKDMKKSAKERQKAFADIENARRAEAREDWKSAQAFEDKAEARLDRAREVGVKGIMDVTGKSADIAAAIYKTGVEQQGATQRAVIGASAGADRRMTLTPAQRAEIANKAKDNVQNELKTDMRMQMEMRRNPGLMNTLVQRETERLMAAAEGRTMAEAPGAASPGGNTRMRFDAQGNPIK
jgi:hypothetical protein